MQGEHKKRNFSNWLKAYYEYAKDDFCPEVFHFWTGVSILAAALERKTWIRPTARWTCYPNMYVLLIAKPGMGKSSACEAGIDLLYAVKENCGTLNLIPQQVTEAKFIELMSQQQTFQIGSQLHAHSSGFFYASEASASLKNIYGGGDFLSLITDFYDCRKIWEKGTQKGGKVTLHNICFNLLAGSTFDYLSKLITDDSIMGGFASRLTYVIYDEKKVRGAEWGRGINEKDEKMRKMLIEDLIAIHTEVLGFMDADEEFRKLWADWYPKHDAMRQEMESEKMQTLLVRKSTALVKLCMILCAAESSDMVMKVQHFEKALALVDQVEQFLPKMLTDTQSTKTNTQQGLNQAIFTELQDSGGELPFHKLIALVTCRGFDPKKVRSTLDSFLSSQSGILQSIMDAKGERVRLLANPDKYL